MVRVLEIRVRVEEMGDSTIVFPGWAHNFFIIIVFLFRGGLGSLEVAQEVHLEQVSNSLPGFEMILKREHVKRHFREIRLPDGNCRGN